MISLLKYLEVQQRMEGQKRVQQADFMQQQQDHQAQQEEDEDKRTSLGILKEEGVVPAAAGNNSYGGYADVGKSFQKEFQDSVYGNILGPGDYRRLNQWNSESLSEFSEKYKRSSSSAAEDGGIEDRRVRSRTESSSVVLTNLLGRREETELQMNISARTLRPSGGKDRHSKVFTAKGPRDRRVRLSVSTAIQFYDVQDRLGYDQPSKAVEWLMKKAKTAIDELSQIPLPGIDRLVPSSYNPYNFHSTSHENPTEFMPQQQQQAGSGSFSSTSEMHHHHQLKMNEEMEQQQSSPQELKSCGSLQAVDESDGFPSSRSSTRRVELATDITMSVGETGRSNNQLHNPHPQHQQHQQQHQQQHHAGVSSFSTPLNTSSQQQQRQSLQQRSYMYEDPCSALIHEQQQQQQRFQGLFQTSPLQYHHHHHHQQTSLMTTTYLQQQDLLAHHNQGMLQSNGSGTAVLPFGMLGSNSSATPKAYLDQFHSLKIAAAAAAAAGEKSATSASSSSSPGAGTGIGTGRLGNFSSADHQHAEIYNLQQQQQQQQQIVRFPGEPLQMNQGLEEHLRGKRNG